LRGNDLRREYLGEYRARRDQEAGQPEVGRKWTSNKKRVSYHSSEVELRKGTLGAVGGGATTQPLKNGLYSFAKKRR